MQVSRCAAESVVFCSQRVTRLSNFLIESDPEVQISPGHSVAKPQNQDGMEHLSKEFH